MNLKEITFSLERQSPFVQSRDDSSLRTRYSYKLFQEMLLRTQISHNITMQRRTCNDINTNVERGKPITFNDVAFLDTQFEAPPEELVYKTNIAFLNGSILTRFSSPPITICFAVAASPSLKRISVFASSPNPPALAFVGMFTKSN